MTDEYTDDDRYAIVWLDGSEQRCRTQHEVYRRINRRANQTVATMQTIQTALKKTKDKYSRQFDRSLRSMGVDRIYKLA